MKNLFLFLALLLAFEGYSQKQPDNTQPTGMWPFMKPQNVRGIRYEGLKAIVEFYAPRKDTMWTPAEPGALTFWEHAGVDTTFWYCAKLTGRKWYKFMGGSGSVYITNDSVPPGVIGDYDDVEPEFPVIVYDTIQNKIKAQPQKFFAWQDSVAYRDRHFNAKNKNFTFDSVDNFILNTYDLQLQALDGGASLTSGANTSISATDDLLMGATYSELSASTTLALSGGGGNTVISLTDSVNITGIDRGSGSRNKVATIDTLTGRVWYTDFPTTDTHLGNTNLTSTGNRTFAGEGNSLTFSNLSSFTASHTSGTSLVIGNSISLTTSNVIALDGSTVSLGTTPTTSAGSYDVLTRNSSTGVIEKVASTLFSNDWKLTGNSTTSGIGTFLGTTSNTSLRIRTNDVERLVLDSIGNLGMGIAPSVKVHLHSAAGVAFSTIRQTDADVAHGITEFGITTNTVGQISAWSGTLGGQFIQGLSTGTVPAQTFYGILGSATPTSTVAAIKLIGAKKNGSVTQALGSSETVFQIGNGSAGSETNLFTVLGNGNIDIEVAPTTSAGTYDILTRNTSTGVVEKIASSTFVTTRDRFGFSGEDATAGENRTFATGSAYKVTISGSITSDAVLKGINTSSSGYGIYGEAVGGYGVWGSTSGTNGYGVIGNATGTDGTGVYGESTSGAGISGRTQTGVAGIFYNNPASTNTVTESFRILRASQGTGANGIGQYISFHNNYGTAVSDEANRLVSKWTDVSARTSSMEMWVKNSNSIARKLELAGDGALTLDSYGSGTITGTPTYILAVNSSGKIIETALAVTTASNGLTAASGDIKLGGTLSQATTIAKDGNAFLMNGAGNATLVSKSGSDSSTLHLTPTFSDFYTRNSTNYNGISTALGSTHLFSSNNLSDLTDGAQNTYLLASKNFAILGGQERTAGVTYGHNMTVGYNQIFFAVTNFSELKVVMEDLPIYANDAAAAALDYGQLYRTSTGEVRFKL